MSEISTQIFIASRFGEFAELRKHLCERINSFPVFPLNAVDFNDGRMSHKPPVDNCITAVKQSEVMILILGSTYGSIPKGYKFGYTHLEYKAAIEDDSNTVVLPFFVGDSYLTKSPPFTDHDLLQQFQAEIMDNHTPGFLIEKEDPSQQALRIFEWIWKTLYDARTKTVQQQMEVTYRQEYITCDNDLTFDDVNLSGLQSDEISFLEEKFDKKSIHTDSVFEVFANKNRLITDACLLPASTAAFEQYEDAMCAFR